MSCDHKTTDGNPMAARCLRYGWEEVALPDGRRGLWRRHGECECGALRVELCAGREGDDAYVCFTLGEVVSHAQLADLDEVALCVGWSFEFATSADRSKALFRDARRWRVLSLLSSAVAVVAILREFF